MVSTVALSFLISSRKSIGEEGEKRKQMHSNAKSSRKIEKGLGMAGNKVTCLGCFDTICYELYTIFFGIEIFSSYFQSGLEERKLIFISNWNYPRQKN